MRDHVRINVVKAGFGSVRQRFTASSRQSRQLVFFRAVHRLNHHGLKSSPVDMAYGRRQGIGGIRAHQCHDT